MTGRIRLLILTLSLSLSPAPAALADWSTDFGPTGFCRHGKVTAAAEFHGDLVVAGHYHTAGGHSARNMARWDGEHWWPLGEGPEGINCLAVHEGKLIAGRKVSARDTLPATALASWNGAVWQDFPGEIQGEVLALAIYRGDLIAGGRFSLGGDDPIQHLARWDGQVWHSLGDGIARGGRTRVEALAVHQGRLVVGGVFGQAGSVQTYHLATWDGLTWSGFGTGASDAVTTLCSSGTMLFAAGNFRLIDGDSVANIAAWNGRTWSSLGEGVAWKPPANPVVNDMEFWRGQLMVAGQFTEAGGISVGSIASWDGLRWHANPPGFFDGRDGSSPEEVLVLHPYQGQLVAAGKMDGSKESLVNGLALWDGTRWDPLVTGQGLDASAKGVKKLAGRICLEGQGTVGPDRHRGPLYWTADGWQPFGFACSDSLDFIPDFKMLTEIEGGIVALGRLVAAGSRYPLGRRSAPWVLARWNGHWEPISPPLDREVSRVNRLVSVCGLLVAMGQFKGADGQAEGGVFWDGQVWRTLIHEDGEACLGAATVANDKLYHVRSAHSEEEGPIFLIEEWNGQDWRTIKRSTGCRVMSLAGAENRLLVSFQLSPVNCSEKAQLQEWDGKNWRPLPGVFSNHFAGDGRVQSLGEYRGHLIAAGSFQGVDGRACGSVAWLDGETWRPMESGIDGDVRSMACTDSSLWFAGGFDCAGGAPSRMVARWDGPLPRPAAEAEQSIFTPEARPETRRGGGWHSHTLDLTKDPKPFANGRFTAWIDGWPEDWDRPYTWRKNAEKRKPMLHPLAEGGVVIEAGTAENSNASLAQRFAVEGGKFYGVRVRYQALFTDHDGSRPVIRMTVGDYRRNAQGYEYGPLHTGMWVGLESRQEDWAQIILRAAPDAKVATVTLSLFQPGARLTLYEVTVEVLDLTDDQITRLLIHELQNNYVPQSSRSVDLTALEKRFLSGNGPGQPGDGRFFGEVLKTLGEYRVYLQKGESDMTSNFLVTEEEPLPEADRLTPPRQAAIRDQLMDCEPQRGPASSGWTSDGLAYVKLIRPEMQEEKLADLASAEGILIDLRDAGRGSISRPFDLLRVLDLAGHFHARPAMYGETRKGQGPFGERDSLYVEPAEDLLIDVPVVCLVGQGCSGLRTEFAMMMQAQGRATLVGRSTRGGTGQMTRFPLPTGSIVHFPGGTLRTPQGDLVNDSQGLQPDVQVLDDGTLDPVFREGLRVLRAKVKERH